MYDPSDPESAKGAVEYVAETDEAVLQGSLGQPIGILPSQAVNVYGPACFNYQDWMRRIKKAFDPNIASDPAFYIEP